MAVIGRLDGQVEEVLITPLERGRERERPAVPPPPTPPETEDEPSADETSPAPDELPVWLL
jgi:hypothetical protein